MSTKIFNYVECPVCKVYPCDCFDPCKVATSITSNSISSARPETIRQIPNGGFRDKEEIPLYHLYPRIALIRTLARYAHGVEKYPPARNWEKGLDPADCYNRAVEHLSKYANGFDDEDHLAAAVFNINCLMTYESEGIVPITFRREFKGDLYATNPRETA